MNPKITRIKALIELLEYGSVGHLGPRSFQLFMDDVGLPVVALVLPPHPMIIGFYIVTDFHGLLDKLRDLLGLDEVDLLPIRIRLILGMAEDDAV